MGLDSVELVMAIEEGFGIAIDDHEAAQLTTVGDLYRCVLRLLSAAPPADPPRDPLTNDEVWQRLAEIIAEEIGLDRGQIHPEARIVDDLRID